MAFNEATKALQFEKENPLVEADTDLSRNFKNAVEQDGHFTKKEEATGILRIVIKAKQKFQELIAAI